MIKLNGKAVELKHFPDGTFLIKEKPSCDQAFLSWKFEHNDELVALIYITQHLRAHGVRYVELYMPYSLIWSTSITATAPRSLWLSAVPVRSIPLCVPTMLLTAMRLLCFAAC